MNYQKSWVERDITRDELACVYSALILADDDIPVTGDKIKTILKAADIEVESIWPSLFAKALQGIDIKDFIVGAVRGGGLAPAAAGPAAVQQDTSQEQAAPAPPVEEEEDSDEDMGLSLFD